MKIYFFTDHFAPEISAPAAHIYERSKIWVEQGHDVTIITNVPNYPLGEPYKGYENRIRQYENMDGIKVLRVGTYMAENKGTLKRTLDYISFAISSFLNAIHLPKPDVVYSTTPHLFSPLGGVFFALLKRVPHVLEVRDLWPASIAATTSMTKNSMMYRALELLESFLYRRSKRIILFTEAFKKDLVMRGIPEHKLDVVVNGANLDLFADPVNDEELANSLGLAGKFVVAYFGTMGLAHGLLNVIRAAEIVESDDIHFLFVGEGAEKENMQALAAAQGSGNIHFVGRKNRSLMPHYWGLCKVGLVHLKNDELFESVIPSKIFETMAVGLPIAYCGPQGEATELLRRTGAALIAEEYSPEALAKVLREYKHNASSYESIKLNSAGAAEEFSRGKQASNTMDVLAQAASSRNS